ncbi:MAG: arylsulfatase B [Chlamydiales bacterium]|jgi:arylsulfatase B
MTRKLESSRQHLRRALAFARRLQIIPTVACILLTTTLTASQLPSPDQDTAPGPSEVPLPPNVVLIVIDDFGIDLMSGYGEHSGAPNTPYLDDLATSGLLFRNCWTNPICSPTRAQILTGRHGFRTGVGSVVSVNHSNTNIGLDLSEVTIPEKLATIRPYPYASSAVGKWHLVDDDDSNFLGNPQMQGFDDYSGAMFNLNKNAALGGDPCMADSTTVRLGYCKWVKNNGVAEVCEDRYATLDTTEDAVQRASAMQEPWFLYVAYNAVHSPFHEPPDSTCQLDCMCAPSGDKVADLAAMVVDLDQRIGDMLTRIRMEDPNTLVIVIGDNGTDGQAINEQGCFVADRAKATPYEAGVNVPLIINGPGVTPGHVEALVNSTDIFSTVMRVAGGTHTATDSVSLVPFFTDAAAPGRDYVYAEQFGPNFLPGQFDPTILDSHTRTIRDRDGFKLIVRWNPTDGRTEEFYDLNTDPCELTSLCTSDVGDCMPTGPPRNAYRALVAELARMEVYP